MSRSPATELIAKAYEIVWPAVTEEIASIIEDIAEEIGMGNDEVVLQAVDNYFTESHRSERRRVIAQRTLREACNAGLLRSEHDAAVIAAAKAWAAVDIDEDDQAVLDAADDDLLDAVKALPDHRQQVAE